MVSKEEKIRRAEEKERKIKWDANKKFWIQTSIAIGILITATYAAYKNHSQSDRLDQVEIQLKQVNTNMSILSLEIENIEILLDSIQTARIDTSEK